MDVYLLNTYHRLSEKHLQRYADEFATRHNSGPLLTMEQIGKTVDGMVGKKIITTGFRFFHCERHEKRTKASRSPFRKS